jgi:putative membrane protein
MMGDMGDFGGWGPGFGWIFMILIWFLIILGVVALVKSLFGYQGGSTSRQRTPLDILQERYARGEIDKDEYEEKKRDLEAL